jgi:putative oxidoreductase
MKIVSHIARILLALVFVVFGANGFFSFMPAQLPPGLAGQFLGAILASHYVLAVSAVMVIGGLLLLLNVYVPLALVLLAPILVNILLFHLFMNLGGIGPGAVLTVCWFLVAWRVRPAFAGLFLKKV